MLITAENYFLYFILYSVLGWIYETALCSVKEKHFVNRGFLNGPYCPIYGTGAVLFILLLGRERSPLLIFVFGAIIASAVEYATSFFMEKIFNARWWDYSEFKFNLRGRICLGASLVFGAFAVLLIKFIHPVTLTYTKTIPIAIYHAVTLACALAFLSDLALTLKGLDGFSEKIALINEKLFAPLSDDEKSKASSVMFESSISRQQRRIIRAFPKISSPGSTQIRKKTD